MNIYTFTNREWKTAMRAFGKCVYGRIVFCLSYSVFFISLASWIVSVVCCVLEPMLCSFLAGWLFVWLGFILVSFILGNIYFYHQLVKFIETTGIERTEEH